MKMHKKARIGTFVMADGPMGCYVGFLERLNFKRSAMNCTLAIARSAYPTHGGEVERFVSGRGSIDLGRIIENPVFRRVHLAHVAAIWELPDSLMKCYLDSKLPPP